MISTDTLKSLGETSTPCVIPRVDQHCGPWMPFWQANTSWCNQNSARRPCSFGPALYPYSVCRIRPQSRFMYALLRSSNTRNTGVLVHTCQLLGDFDLHNCGPCTPTCTKPMQDIVKIHCCLNVGIYHHLHHLPHDLQHHYPTDISIKFWD